MVFVFLCLISLSIMLSRSSHVIMNGRSSLFLLLNILFFTYTCVFQVSILLGKDRKEDAWPSFLLAHKGGSPFHPIKTQESITLR